MIETTESWYVVRNTRGVTGFVGPDSKPVALTDDEVERMLNPESKNVSFDIAIGEEVSILSGPFENFKGVVADIDAACGKLSVTVEMFGRPSTVQLDMEQVKRADE